MTSMTVTEARAALPSLLTLVENGGEVTITRHGKPVAVLKRPELARNPRTAAIFAEAQRISELLETARHQPLSGPGLSAEYADDLIREIRAGRDGE